jgi:hypothetical protein
MTRCSRILAFLLAIFPAVQAVGQDAAAAGAPDPAEQIKQLRAQRERLKREGRDKLRAELARLKKELAKDADLAPLRTAVAEARKALDQKEQADPQILEAEKAYKAARQAYDKGKADAAATDPTVAALKQGVEAEYKRADEAEKSQKDAKAALSEMKKKLAQSPDVAEAAKKLKEAQDALDEVPKTSAAVGAAAKAVTDARELYEKARRALPEYKALAEADKAYDQARRALPEYKTRKDDPKAYDKAEHALPEYKARKAAEEAYEKARHALPEYKARKDAEAAYAKQMSTDPAVLSAMEAVSKARKEYDQKLEALIAADPQGAELLAKIRKADSDIEDARKNRAGIRKRLDDAERASAKNSPVVAEARKAYEAAYEARKKVVDERTVAEEKVLDEAGKAFDKKLDEKLAADVKAAAIAQELKATEARIDELKKQITALETRKAPE